jgi:hypothetical protein
MRLMRFQFDRTDILLLLQHMGWCIAFNTMRKNPESDRQSCRERIQMVRDMILKLVEYGQINQTVIKFLRA